MKIKNALISVSNKDGIVDFAKQLNEMGVQLISTGGTASLLRAENIPVRDVADLTGYPEIMDGRVKTLHPKVHGGILGRRDVDKDCAQELGIEWIDLVVVNLYPFEKVIQDPQCNIDEAIENIDIGGPTIIRSAAKNHAFVTVVTDPKDYDVIISQLNTEGINATQRQALAKKAFAYTSQYDLCIHQYFARLHHEIFPSEQHLRLTNAVSLRYGENPDQKACAYTLKEEKGGILEATQHQGKRLSYNNLVDADAALNCIKAFIEPACVIIKHANPCGAAQATTSKEAFLKAFSADSLSAFGGIVAFNTLCDEETAKVMLETFFEVIIAPQFTQSALALFSTKPNLRLLSSPLTNLQQSLHYQHIHGAILVQEKSHSMIQLNTVTQLKPTKAEIEELLFAWEIVKHVKSNAIVITQDKQTLGIGAGQVSRIGAVQIALNNAKLKGKKAVLASDAFFPFRDSIDQLAQSGISAIIQPGGSLQDKAIIAACDEHKIAMVFTGVRCFKH